MYFPKNNNAAILFSENRCFEEYFRLSDGQAHLVATGGAVLEATDSSTCTLRGGIAIGANGRQNEIIANMHITFPFGSARQEEAVENFLNAIRQGIPTLAERVAARLEAGG